MDEELRKTEAAGTGEEASPEQEPGKEKMRQKRKRKKHPVLRAFFLCLLALILTGVGAGYVIIKPRYDEYKEIAYEKLAGMSRADFSMRSDTEIFDKDGNRIGLINAGHYEYVPISGISQNLQNAYIAQEDKRFLRHNGVDWIATARAGLTLIRNGGRITQGGSTITQQVIKNNFLTQEQTFSRKIIEILMAPEIEKKYTKADIMEFYCNTNFYGNHCYGVQAASRYYFGKDASELSVPEAATLAGISNSPSRYDPVRNPEACKEKRNRVLASMNRVGYLTDTEYQDYCSAPLAVVQETQEGTNENYQSSYALHCAALELMKLEGFSFQYLFDSQEAYDAYMEEYSALYAEKSSELRGGGYRIYTTLDSEIQKTVQEELDQVLSVFTELQDNGKFALQGAGVIVDNRQGCVVAVVGGRGSEDPLNRAYNAARQPGSCIKPLLDYGPAFDTGEYYPARIVNDHKWENGPANSGGRYYGNVTVRFALNQSLNTVAWQVLEDIGIRTGMEYLARMQFQQLQYIDSSVPSVSIGGFTRGVRVVDMAKGYSTLASGGIYTDQTCIERIEQEELGDLTVGLREEKRQVYREDTAWMLTDVLKGTFTEGTARGLSLAGDMPCAGKTGTTNDSKDTWFCGYTKYYTGAFWVGYDTPRAMPGVYGATYAGKIWQQVMNRLHEGLAPLDFEKPVGVEQRTESDGHSDWRSVTDLERAAQSLHEKEQAKEAEEIEKQLTAFENHAISRLEDIEGVRSEYAEIMNRASLLDDSPKRTEFLERAEARSRENEAVIEDMGDTIALWEEQKRLEEERMKADRESAAAESRQRESQAVNRQEVQNAIDAIYGAEYQSGELTGLVNEAIRKLALVSGYPEEQEYSDKLDAAISYASGLPSEAEWQQARAAEEAARAASEAAEAGRTRREQESLAQKYEASTAPAPSIQPATEAPKYGPEGGPGV